MLREVAVALVELGDRLGLGGVEQADRAAGEDAAVAAQIGRPGGVRDLVRQGLGDVDGAGIQRFGDQRGTAREVVVDLLLGPLARVGDPALEVAGQFVDLGELVAQLHRGLAADAGRLAGGGFEAARDLVGALAQRLRDGRLAVFA